ncbi:MAG: rhomboid family intramembrane serine protease [Bacteroidota bacterium]
MNQFRPNSFKLLPDVVKNLLIINILFYIGTIIFYNRLDIDLTELLGLHMVGSSKFEVYQFVTYMFLHDPNNFSHILFNMFALWMFGNAIENTWGSKRFLIYYLVTGIGAAVIQYAVFYFELRPTLEIFDVYLQNPSNEALVTLFQNGKIISNGSTELQMLISEFTDKYNALVTTAPDKALQLSVEFMQQYRADFLSLPTVIGASGAVFGLLLAFGMMFPNSVIYIYFLIPLKAKYFVIIYGALELVMGFTGSQSNVAHFAHLGGMLFGFILIQFWKKKYGYI